MRKERYLAPGHRNMEELTAEVGGEDLEKLGAEEVAALLEGFQVHTLSGGGEGQFPAILASNLVFQS